MALCQGRVGVVCMAYMMIECYPLINIPLLAMRIFRSILPFILLFSLIAENTSHAFVDTSSMEKSLDTLEEELDTGLGGILEELEEASGENADDYLTTDADGEAVTLWDVPKDAWFYSYVETLTDLGIVSGYKDADGKPKGLYGSENPVTRAETIKIAVGSAGIDPTSCGTPKHPKATTHWASAYVACAEARNFGITAGMDLDAPIGRAEALHYFLMAFGVNVPEGNPPFADSSNHPYKNDIAYAYALEIVSGDTNADESEKGTFRPDDNLNRAALAKIATLAIELL